MEVTNLLTFTSRQQLRAWFEAISDLQAQKAEKRKGMGKKKHTSGMWWLVC